MYACVDTYARSMNAVDLDVYQTCVEKIKKYAAEHGVAEEKTLEIFQECFRRLESRHLTKTRKPFALLMKVICAVLTLSILSAVFVYNHPSYNSVLVRNLQTSIYPGLKFLRKLAIPVVRRFPSLSEVYDEWCLLENPYFYVSDMDCWPCSVVTSVPDLTGRNVSETFNFGIPFTRMEADAVVTFGDLMSAYEEHRDIFEQDAKRVSSNNASYRTMEDVSGKRLDLAPSLDEDVHIVWRINRMRPGRVLRKLFGRQAETPNWWSQSTEKFVIIDEANSSVYSLPNTECSNVVVKCAHGGRLIKMVPTAECSNNCRASTILLSQEHTLWYNWWYWRPMSLPVSNSTEMTITYVTSYC